MIRVLNASTETDTTSANDVVAIPMKNNDVAIMTNPAVIGMRLSYRDTSHAEIGSPISIECTLAEINSCPRGSSVHATSISPE